MAPSPPMAWKELKQPLEALMKFSWRNEDVRLLLCQLLRGSDSLRDYEHWAVLCILANCLKRQYAYVLVGEPLVSCRSTACVITDCKKDKPCVWVTHRVHTILVNRGMGHPDLPLKRNDAQFPGVQSAVGHRSQLLQDLSCPVHAFLRPPTAQDCEAGTQKPDHVCSEGHDSNRQYLLQSS